MVVSDQFVLCKAALIFAVTRCLLSFALNLITSSIGLFSSSPSDSSTQPSSCCSTSSSSPPNLRILRDTLSLTTYGEIEHRLPESHDVSCAVCLNRLKKNSQVWELNNCSHVFHKQCLERWLCYDNRFTCPLCRASCSRRCLCRLLGCRSRLAGRWRGCFTCLEMICFLDLLS